MPTCQAPEPPEPLEVEVEAAERTARSSQLGRRVGLSHAEGNIKWHFGAGEDISAGIERIGANRVMARRHTFLDRQRPMPVGAGGNLGEGAFR